MLDQTLFTVGGISFTLIGILAPILVVAGAIILASLVARSFRRLHRRASPSRATLVYVSGQLLRYAILFAGVMLAISAAGLNLSSFSLFAGALGVGVGLGLQDVVRNFTYGIILMFEQSVEVGDFIELEDGTAGAVVAIGARATTITTNDNVDVLIPNALLLSGPLTNWTRNHATRRVHVPFGVAYGSDKELVKKAALEAARAVPFTQENETLKTQVWLTGFGDSALEFELVVWPTLDAVKRPGSMFAAYRWALDDALARHGLEIPFPQRDIRVRTLFGTEGSQALRHISRREGEPRVAGLGPDDGTIAPEQGDGRSGNDAAEDIVKAASSQPVQPGPPE